MASSAGASSAAAGSSGSSCSIAGGCSSCDVCYTSGAATSLEVLGAAAAVNSSDPTMASSADMSEVSEEQLTDGSRETELRILLSNRLAACHTNEQHHEHVLG